jgi:transposase
VVIDHRPGCCGGCGADLAEAVVVGEVRRQVVDLPKVTPVITDHVAYRCRCSCGTETLAAFAPEARSPVCFGPEVRAFAVYLLDRQHLPIERTAELIADLLGVEVSTGWLCQVQLEAAGKLTGFIGDLKDRLAAEPVLHADETGTRVRTTKHWVHTLCSGLLTLIAVHPKRGRQALEDIGVLGAYAGTLVHDGYASYDYLHALDHAQCHAHLVRHLKDVGKTDLYKAWTGRSPRWRPCPTKKSSPRSHPPSSATSTVTFQARPALRPSAEDRVAQAATAQNRTQVPAAEAGSQAETPSPNTCDQGT